MSRWVISPDEAQYSVIENLSSMRGGCFNFQLTKVTETNRSRCEISSRFKVYFYIFKAVFLRSQFGWAEIEVESWGLVILVPRGLFEQWLSQSLLYRNHVNSSWQNDIRSSLLLSMLKQMLMDDKAEEVREAVVKSLGLVIGFIGDRDKYIQVWSWWCRRCTTSMYWKVFQPPADGQGFLPHSLLGFLTPKCWLK